MYALRQNVDTKPVGVMMTSLAVLSRRLRALSHSLGQGGVVIPHHAGSFAVGGLFAVTLLYGLAAGGHTAQALKMTSSSFGFAVENIAISGVSRISEIDVLEALSLDGDASMLGFDLAEAQEKLNLLPWIEAASLRKIYPDRLQIDLVERQPLALWQNRGKLSIIDREGRIIVPYNAGAQSADVRSLPLVVGRGAEREAAAFLHAMEAFPQLRERVRAYIRVAGRRWDLVLENGIEIKLPEHGAIARLAHILERDGQENILSRDVLSVDLRLDDRIVLALSDAALARRQAEVKELERAAKARKAGRV